MANETNHAASGWEWGQSVRRTIVMDAKIEEQIAKLAKQKSMSTNDLMCHLIEEGLRATQERPYASAV